jgi:hypothetical protein
MFKVGREDLKEEAYIQKKFHVSIKLFNSLEDN